MCRLWLCDYFHVLTGGRASAMQGIKLPNCSENRCADAQRCCEEALKISPGEKVIPLSYSI